MALMVWPPLPSTILRWLSRSTKIVCSMRTEPSGPLLPLVRLDRRVVGQLLVQALVDLLAGDLGGEHAQRHIGDLVLRVEPRTFRHLVRPGSA